MPVKSKLRAFPAHVHFLQITALIASSRLTVADWTHLNDFSIDEFHSILWTQNAGFGHPVILVHREKFFSDFDAHRISSLESILATMSIRQLAAMPPKQVRNQPVALHSNGLRSCGRK